MSTATIRVLKPGDERALERYLASRPDTTLFLQGNLRAVGGLGADPTRPYGGVHVARWVDGRVAGVAAHFWNGRGIIEADHAPDRLLALALAETGRPLVGLLGPAAQVRSARRGLGLADAKTTMDSIEGLFALELASLRVPEALASGAVRCRRARPADLSVLVAWGAAYLHEAIGEPRDEATLDRAREGLERGMAEGRSFVLAAGDRLLSKSAFNSRTPDCVQIGGVYTPPALRSQGHGRGVVAGSLHIAAGEGITRSVLFTGEDNLPAQRCYQALGYERCGDYAIVQFREPQALRH